jgi:uncharacterized protein (TIGR01777 family)
MTTLLTGATGFVGKRLLPRLEDPVIFSRNAQRAKEKLAGQIKHAIEWDPVAEDLSSDHFSSLTVDSVINLMGEPIAEGRWNADKKKRIRDSRVLGTRRLIDALLKADRLPKVMISASAVGIYGDSGEKTVEEDSPHGSGFLTEVCEEWEAEALRFEQHGVRVVLLRIGIVMGIGGGALDGLIPVFKSGAGGPLGSGKQWVPWIHVDDLVNLILWCRENEAIRGPVNASAPNPVRNKELAKALGRCLGRPAIIPAPKFAVRLALGEFADSLFYSQRVVPATALSHGFNFEFTQLSAALEDLIK